MKLCYIRKITLKDLPEVLSKGTDIIVNNPESIPEFKGVDPEYIKKFAYAVANEELQDYQGYVMVDSEDHKKLVGVLLVSMGNPWYNPNITVLNEELTIAFEKGYGITRVVIDFLHSALDLGFTMVQASAANTCVAKLIENSYIKQGFKTYKTFYKSK